MDIKLAIEFAHPLLEALLASSPDRVLVYDTEGRFLFANTAAARFQGRSLGEMKGHSWRELGYPDDIGHPFEARLLQVVQGKCEIRAEETLVAEDGQPQHLETILSPVFDADSCVVAVLNIIRDVGERRRMEDEVREAEGRLRTLLNAMPDFVCFKDGEGRWLEMNEAGLRVFQLEGRPYKGKAEAELGDLQPFFREAFTCCQASDEEAWRRGQISRVEEILPDPSGEPRVFDVFKIPLFQANGTRKGLVALGRDITREQATAVALREQEEQYRTLFLTMAQGVVYQDAEGRVISANPAAEKILGLSMDQMLGRTSMDPRWGCIHEDGTPFLGEEHPAMVALRTGRPVEGVVMGVFHPLKEKYLWIVVSAIPEFSANQVKPWRVFATLADISELKSTQDDLRRTARHLHAVIDNSQAVIFQLDPEGRFLLSEGRGLALLGLQPGQVVGLSALEMYRDSPITLAALKTALAGGACRAFLEVRGLIFDTNLSPVLGEDGRVESVIGVSTDVTEREKAQRSLQESEQKFRDLLAKLGEGFGLVDANETFTFANPAAEAIFGVGEGQLVGRNLSEFLDPEDFHQAQAHTQQRMMGRKETYEVSIRRPNQERRQILVNVTPILDAKGTYLGANGLIQDITERRLAEATLRQAQKLESLGVLAGGIAHDFNNLLTAILGNLNLAQARLTADSDAIPLLENVEKTVLRAADLTKQMLAYSGKGRFVVKLHDLNVLVQEMTHLMQVSIPKKTVLRFMLHPEVVPIDADATQIHQVVMNLVTNAADAIGEAEGVISVTTRIQVVKTGAVPAANPGQTLASGTYAVLEVCDSGCGMSPEVIERIFDPFFSTKAAGRGLGLSAMLGILRGHKAGIQIRSEKGQGSTFCVYLPMAVTIPESAVPVEIVSSQHFTGEALVVDDEPMVLEFAAKALTALGFKTTEARDGLEAVDIFTKAPDRFDLILLDLTMPRMDGREALRAIRHLRPEIPVILSSGYSDQEFIQNLAAEPGLTFLQKPYLLANLRQAVQGLVR